MKTLFISLAVVLFLQPDKVHPQTAIDNLYEKYAGQEGFTSININPDMFKMISGLDMSDSSEKAKEAQNAMEQIAGLKMLVYEPEEGETNEEFMEEIKSLSKIKGYEEMMSVNEGDEVVKFLTKKGTDGKMLEMLMIVLEDDEAVVMSMTGDMDLKIFTEISKSLGVTEMDDLNIKSE